MKNLKKIVINLVFAFILIGHVRANDLFLYDVDTNGTELSEVTDNKLTVLQNVVGKTYSLKNNLSIVNSTNSYSFYTFPHKLSVYQRELTSTYFNNDDTIQYYNDFKLPEVVKVKEQSFTFSVNGELYVVSESSTTNVIGTSMVNVVFASAKLFIKSGEKYTQVYVDSGIVTVLDTKSSKKKKELKSGDYLVVTPQITLSPREGSVKSNNSSFSIKEVEDDELKLHSENFDKVKRTLDNSLFINYNENIIGVKLK